MKLPVDSPLLPLILQTKTFKRMQKVQIKGKQTKHHVCWRKLISYQFAALDGVLFPSISMEQTQQLPGHTTVECFTSLGGGQCHWTAGVRADRNERRDVQLPKTKRICTWEIGRNPTKESISADSNPPILSGTMLVSGRVPVSYWRQGICPFHIHLHGTSMKSCFIS